MPTAPQSVQQQHCSRDDVAASAVAVWKRSWSLSRVDYSRTAGPAAAAAAAPAPLRGRWSLRPSPPAAALAAFVHGGMCARWHFCSRLASSQEVEPLDLQQSAPRRGQKCMLPQLLAHSRSSSGRCATAAAAVALGALESSTVSTSRGPGRVSCRLDRSGYVQLSM